MTRQAHSSAPLSATDVERYLARLGVLAPSTPTAAALGDLVRAHVNRIPFENLLIQLNQPAALDPAVTVARIARGGGGYCLELNAAFGALLAALGYEVIEHEGRCWVGEPDPPGAPVNHLTLTVRCNDDSWWLVEVGMSDAVCEPLRLQAGNHRQGPFAYRLETLAGRGWRFHHDPRGSFGGMDFYEVPARRDVIEAAHHRLATAVKSPFTRLLSVGRRDLSAAEILRGRVLIRWDVNGRTLAPYTDRDEWFRLLRHDFGLPVDELAKPDRQALWRRVCAAHAAWETSQGQTE